METLKERGPVIPHPLQTVGKIRVDVAEAGGIRDHRHRDDGFRTKQENWKGIVPGIPEKPLPVMREEVYVVGDIRGKAQFIPGVEDMPRDAGLVMTP